MVVVGILLVDFAALVVAVGTVYSATKAVAAASIVVEILFDLKQTLVTNHSDLANGFQELENKIQNYNKFYFFLTLHRIDEEKFLLDAALFIIGIFGIPLAPIFALFGWPLCCCC